MSYYDDNYWDRKYDWRSEEYQREDWRREDNKNWNRRHVEDYRTKALSAQRSRTETGS